MSMSRVVRVSCVLSRAGVLWVLLGACAQGFEGPAAFGFDTPGGSQGGGQVGDGSGGDDEMPTAGGGMAGAGGMSGSSGGAFDGEPCTRGEVQACECDNGGTGSRTCAFDAASPTEGSFGDCARCSGGAGSGGSGSSGSGGSGSSGSGGRGGSGGSGSSGSGGSSGGSGSGGSSGSAGSSGGSAGSGSAPGWCIFVPIPIPGC
jgi:loricrin